MNSLINKSEFQIAKMDCPSEEQLIRMALADTTEIHSLIFDIPNRTLTVFHEGSAQLVLNKLQPLHLQSSLLETITNVSVSSQENKEKNTLEQQLLWTVLGINFGFFLIEMLAGWWYGSMGLIADSLDMLADSFVYALALFAVGKSASLKKNTATLAGVLQLLLALFGLFEVARRFISQELLPNSSVMMGVSFLALLGNISCLYLLMKSRSKEAHMQASMIFTSNDIIINTGVIIAGALVWMTESLWPDLLVGALVFVIVIRGAWRILRL